MDLSGDWTGVYEYGFGGADAVPFAASLFDVGGVVWGSSLEPNTFSPGAGEELEAEISGSRSSRELHFRKVYLGRPVHGEDPVHYTGLVSADGTRIEGRWTIRNFQGSQSGPFVMNRLSGAKIAVTKSARATLTLDVR